MIFSVHGPFALPRKGRRLLTSASDRRKFWSSVDAKVPGLSSACGCYVFTVRGQAWYVGLAEKQSFNPECYSSHKIVLFREALDAVMGPANLIFLAKRTLQDRFAKPTVGSYPAARMLENMLIGLATARNKRLLNIRGTRFLKSMRVPGIINSGRGRSRAIAVQKLKYALGV